VVGAAAWAVGELLGLAACFLCGFGLAAAVVVVGGVVAVVAVALGFDEEPQPAAARAMAAAASEAMPVRRSFLILL
jgi:hypothetical protein